MPASDATITFRDIPGFPGYQAGDDGSVRSRWAYHARPSRLGDHWRQLTPILQKRGRFTVNLKKPDSKGFKVLTIHRLVMLAFVGPCPVGMQVCHYNGIPTDNRLSNLRYDTPKGNAADKRRHGTHVRGERQGQAVLTEATVRDIKRRIAAGEKQRAIARDLGIKPCRVSFIATGRDWAWVG